MQPRSWVRFAILAFAINMPKADSPETVEWTMLDPNRLLVEMGHSSARVNAVWAEAWAANPPSQARPWSLVLGFDEFAPGNKLQVDNRRKMMVLSFTFMELGFVGELRLGLVSFASRTSGSADKPHTAQSHISKASQRCRTARCGPLPWRCDRR